VGCEELIAEEEECFDSLRAQKSVSKWQNHFPMQRQWQQAGLTIVMPIISDRPMGILLGRIAILAMVNTMMIKTSSNWPMWFRKRHR
jgi:hypothetical protein